MFEGGLRLKLSGASPDAPMPDPARCWPRARSACLTGWPVPVLRDRVGR